MTRLLTIFLEPARFMRPALLRRSLRVDRNIAGIAGDGVDGLSHNCLPLASHMRCQRAWK